MRTAARPSTASLLDEIHSRRDSLAIEHAAATRRLESDESKAFASTGALAFTRWFSDQRSARRVVMSSPHIIDVQPELSSCFAIGIYEHRYYLAIPEQVWPWFSDMPWLHVAIQRNGSVLSLVCERVKTPLVNLPAFALKFETGCASRLKLMTSYHYLDVRRLVPMQGEPGGERVALSRDVVMALDIRVLDDVEGFDALLDGRTPHGYNNRSAAPVVLRSAPVPTASVPIHERIDAPDSHTPVIASAKAKGSASK